MAALCIDLHSPLFYKVTIPFHRLPNLYSHSCWSIATFAGKLTPCSSQLAVVTRIPIPLNIAGLIRLSFLMFTAWTKAF